MRHHGLRAAILSIRVTLAKIGLTCMGLMCGASIGSMGPTVHVGASIMHSLRHLKFFRGQDTTRSLILAGGAAGISAAFNAPLAGIMFAIEEMSRSYEDKTTGTLLIAVIIAGVTALAIMGDYTYFGSTSVSLSFSEVWPAILVCGFAGGLLGGRGGTGSGQPASMALSGSHADLHAPHRLRARDRFVSAEVDGL